jgi:tetratricopeptide (TPR) repeat protein
MTPRRHDVGGASLAGDPSRPAPATRGFRAVPRVPGLHWARSACAVALVAAAASAFASGPERPRESPGPARPDAAETLARLLDDAESAYRARRWPQAMDAFKAVTAFDPDNARAWLRIGNLHHRRGQWVAAAAAYRKAVPRDGPPRAPDATGAADPADPADPAGAVRAKALLNLASVNLELARAALAELGRLPPELAAARDDIAAQSRVVADQVEQARRPGVESLERAPAP